MRADRLLSILLLLQARGKISAAKLAEELEVSIRTIYRDIDALNTAGVPVYGEVGSEGGYSLLDTYRTRLTGLNEKEIQALFMLGIPEPLMKLGVGQEFKSALLKLSVSMGGGQSAGSKKIHLDSAGWQQNEEPIPYLQTIHQAVQEDKKLYIRFKFPAPGDLELLTEPLGLVAKAGAWYLVYSIHGNIRTVRMLSLVDACISQESFNRPGDFDLEKYWEKWCRDQEATYRSYTVLARVRSEFIPALYMYFGESIGERVENAVRYPNGCIIIELYFETIEAARDRILSFGRGLEVLEPPALRRSVQDYAEQILLLYTDGMTASK